MSDPEKTFELSNRGKRQLKDVIHTELKPFIDKAITELLEPLLEGRVKTMLETRYNSHETDRLIKTQMNQLYWEIMEKALKAADFQQLFKEEIVKYLQKQWACGQIPFEEQLNNALKRALKELIK